MEFPHDGVMCGVKSGRNHEWRFDIYADIEVRASWDGGESRIVGAMSTNVG